MWACSKRGLASRHVTMPLVRSYRTISPLPAPPNGSDNSNDSNNSDDRASQPHRHGTNEEGHLPSLVRPPQFRSLVRRRSPLRVLVRRCRSCSLSRALVRRCTLAFPVACAGSALPLVLAVAYPGSALSGGVRCRMRWFPSVRCRGPWLGRVRCCLGAQAVSFLCHFPSDRSAWVLPSALPCGARTFLIPPGRDAVTRHTPHNPIIPYSEHVCNPPNAASRFRCTGGGGGRIPPIPAERLRSARTASPALG